MLESQAFDNAVENVEKATKLAEKHATDGKVDDVAAGLAKANAELEVRLTRDAPRSKGGLIPFHHRLTGESSKRLRRRGRPRPSNFDAPKSRRKCTTCVAGPTGTRAWLKLNADMWATLAQRDRAVELDAAVPRDPFTKRRGPVFQVPANGMGGIC